MSKKRRKRGAGRRFLFSWPPDRKSRRIARRLIFEPLEGRQLLSASGWQNPLDPLDVNGDGVVNPGDIFASYNPLDLDGPRTLPATASPPPYADVNGDGDHTPSDLARVVNFVNQADRGTFDGVINVRLETTDLNGSPISSTSPGSSFLLRGYVSEGSADPQGVFAAYINVAFDDSLVEPSEPVTFGQSFGHVRSGDLSQNGLLRDVGAVADWRAPLGPGEFPLFEVPFVANAAGRVTFGSAPVSGLGRDTLVWGVNDVVPAAQVGFGCTSLQIGTASPSAPGQTSSSANDYFYLGDAATDNVAKFDAVTGEYLGCFVSSGSAGLHGPNGMVFDQGSLLVVNQNVNLPIDGEVLRYDGQTGAPTGTLVPSLTATSPYSPAGIVVRDNIAYVADTGLNAPSGRIVMYDATTGAFQGELAPREPVLNAFEDPFRPRGLAFGPRGELYVSVFSEDTFATNDPAGYILAFNVETGDYRVVAFNDGDGEVEVGEVADLHNPEGLIVGPDGCLYVTSSRKNPDDTDKVLCVDPITGGNSGWRNIPLDEVGGPRAFAQSILFGPDGKLFVPITGGGPDAGSVRRYDINTGQFDVFIPAAANGGVLRMPSYATFGRTNAATLDYEDPPTISGIETSPVVIEGPLLTGGTSSGTYGTRVTDTIQVADLDGFVSGATVRILGNYHSDQDRLSVFNNGGVISSTWDAATGTLTLTGRDSVDNYRVALQNVFYENNSATPNLSKRTVSFTVNDSPTDSNTLSREILLLKDDLNALFYTTREGFSGGNLDGLHRLDTNTGELGLPYYVPGHEEGAILLANGTNLLAASRTLAPFTGGGEGEEGGFFALSKEHASVIRFPDRATLIADDSAHAPIDPEGMVLDGNTLYVADTRSSLPGVAPIESGVIRRYNATTGEFLNEITASGFAGLFHPRGLAFGPDGSLYVTLYDPNVDANGNQTNPGYGAILKIDAVSPAPVVVAFNNGDGVLDAGETADLHNPGTLTFGPDGKLYVTTRSPDPNALDKIVVLDPNAAFAQVDHIDITRASGLPLHPRAMLFGPDDKLFVSVNEPDEPFVNTAGYLRSYDVATKEFTVTATANVGPIGYFTFGYTNPKTLAFEPPAGAAPILSGIEATTADVFTNAATQVSATLTVGDTDSAQLSGATVTIVSGYDHDRDVLTFQDTATINGIWNPSAGTMRLIGTDSVANYQAALRSIKFQNNSAFGVTPVLGKRTVSLQVTDGEHASNAVTRDVRVSLIRGDYLFIGDQGDPNVEDPTDDTVKQFDVQGMPGANLGNFVVPGRLLGALGLVFNGGNLLAVNQNVHQPFAGEVLRFNGRNGTELAPVVSEGDTQAPFAPRGIVVKDNVLYVADFLGSDTPRIAKYNATTGQFIGDLRPSNFSAPFNPRGLVFGPDGKLYATSYSADKDVVESNDPSGYILKFLDTTTGTVEVIAFNNGNGDTTPGKTAGLHNPEGVVFAPDGHLYVISFRLGASDNAILGFDVATKQQVNSISLGESYGQGLLFGPDEQLFVAISGGPDAGSVRAYDLQGNFGIYVLPGGSLRTPWYMTFTQTDPATLAYKPWHNFVIPLDVDGDGHIAPIDALVIINEINSRSASDTNGLLPNHREAGAFYYDVTGDGFAVPIDALQIINFLTAAATTEGEFVPASESPVLGTPFAAARDDESVTAHSQGESDRLNAAIKSSTTQPTSASELLPLIAAVHERQPLAGANPSTATVRTGSASTHATFPVQGVQPSATSRPFWSWLFRRDRTAMRRSAPDAFPAITVARNN